MWKMVLWGMFTCWCTFSHAQKFDQDYLKWKTEQQAQDQRLQKQSANIDANYYLAKPMLKTTASTQKVSLNQADLKQLQQLHGVGEKKAQAILEYRQQHGGFKSVDELQNVKGIGPKLLEKNRDRLGL